MSDVKTDFDRHVEDAEFRRLFAQEQTIGELTELICREMKRQNISQTELGRRMGKTKGQVSQMLNGTRNLTLRSLSDMLLALGKSLEPLTRPAGELNGRWIRVPEIDQWTEFAKVRAPLSQEENATTVKMQRPMGYRGAA